MNYKIKKFISTLIVISTMSMSVAGCGGLESCGLQSCGLSSCGTENDNTPTPIITNVPTPTEVVATETPVPTNTSTPIPTATNTPTPTIAPAELTVIGNDMQIFLFDSINAMNEAFGETGDNDPEVVGSIIIPDSVAYLRMYVKNPNGQGPETLTSTAPDGTEVTVSNRIMYRGEYELLMDVMADYQWGATFTDENGEPTELEFAWDMQNRCFVIKMSEGQKAIINVSTEVILPTPTPAPTATPTPQATATPTPKPTKAPTKTPTPEPTRAPVTPIAYRADMYNPGMHSEYGKMENDPIYGNVGALREWDPSTNSKSLQKVKLLWEDPNYELVHTWYNVATKSYNSAIVVGTYPNGEPIYCKWTRAVFYFMKKGATPLVYLTSGQKIWPENPYWDARFVPISMLTVQMRSDIPAAELPEVLDDNGNRVYATHAQQAIVTCTPVPTYTPIKVDTQSAKTDNVVHRSMFSDTIPMDTYYLKYTDKLGNELVRFCDTNGNILNEEYFIGYEEHRDNINCGDASIWMTAVSNQQYCTTVSLSYAKNTVLLKAVDVYNKTFEPGDGWVYSSTMWDLKSMKGTKPGSSKRYVFAYPISTYVGYSTEYDEVNNQYLLKYYDITDGPNGIIQTPHYIK